MYKEDVHVGKILTNHNFESVRYHTVIDNKLLSVTDMAGKLRSWNHLIQQKFQEFEQHTDDYVQRNVNKDLLDIFRKPVTRE